MSVKSLFNYLTLLQQRNPLLLSFGLTQILQVSSSLYHFVAINKTMTGDCFGMGHRVRIGIGSKQN